MQINSDSNTKLLKLNYQELEDVQFLPRLAIGAGSTAARCGGVSSNYGNKSIGSDEFFQGQRKKEKQPKVSQ